MVLVFDISQLDLSVDRLLIHIDDLLLAHVIDWLEDLLVVNAERFQLDLFLNLRVLRENLLVKHLLSKSEALNLFVYRHINELGLALVDHVVITNQVSLVRNLGS